MNMTQDLIRTIRNFTLPLGGAFIFISIAIIGFNIIINHSNPRRRSEALSGIMWVATGGLILGLGMSAVGIAIQILR